MDVSERIYILFGSIFFVAVVVYQFVPSTVDGPTLPPPPAMTDSRQGCWPLAAASRIRVKLQQQGQRTKNDAVDDSVDLMYCRFFYNRATGAIDLVPEADAKPQRRHVEIYDDNNDDDIRILEQDPTYESYVATLAAMEATNNNNNGEHNDEIIIVTAVDSFHPKDVIGANLSFENIENDSHASTAAAATANIIVYCYPPSKLKKKRHACHRHYTLDPQCCMDFADARLIIQTIQKLAHATSTTTTMSSSFKDKHHSDDTTSSLMKQTLTLPSSLGTTTNTNTTTVSPMKCLVILNPYSGGGSSESKYSAKHVYTTIVQSMLTESSSVLEFDTLVTQRAGHARERMMMRRRRKLELLPESSTERNSSHYSGPMVEKNEKLSSSVVQGNDDVVVPDEDDDDSASNILNTDSETKDISHYDAILAMGGDGILFEIFQGIHARSDEVAILSSMKFAILPCGTYNGLATSILHWSDIHADPRDYVELMFHVCKGYSSILDVACFRLLRSDATTTRDSRNNIIEWNAVSPASTDKVTISTDNNDSLSISYLSFLTYTWGLIADCDYESECLRYLGHIRSDIWAVYRGILCRKRYHGRFTYLPPSSPASVTCGSSHRVKESDAGTTDGSVNGRRAHNIVLPKPGEPLPKDWVTHDCEEFLVFWVCNTTHAAHNMFTCPVAKMNDGLFHILIVRSTCSRLRLLWMLLQLDSGGHMKCSGLEYVPCIAFQFEPLSEVSYNILDGELIENGTVQACFVSGGAQFFIGENPSTT